MEADVILNGETLELKGNRIAVINDADEFTSKGTLAGFAFHDRAAQGNRYVLYAHGNKVRFWQDDGEGSGRDLLTIDDNKLEVNTFSGEELVVIKAQFLSAISQLIRAGNVEVSEKLTSKDVTTESLTSNKLTSKDVTTESLTAKQIQADSIIINYKPRQAQGEFIQLFKKLDLLNAIIDLQERLDKLEPDLQTLKKLVERVEIIEKVLGIRPGLPTPSK